MSVLIAPQCISESGVVLKAGLSWPDGFEDQFLDARLLSSIYPRLGDAIWRVSARASMSALAATAWWALAACGPGVLWSPKEQVIEAGFVASLDPALTLFNDASLSSLPDTQVSQSPVEQSMLDFVGYLISNGHWALTEGEGAVQNAWYGLAAMVCMVVADPTPIEKWLEALLVRLAKDDPVDLPATALPPPPQFFSLNETDAGLSRAAAWERVLGQLAREPNPFLRDPRALRVIKLG